MVIRSFSMLNVHRCIFKLWRKKRFQLFIKIIQPKATDVLLDVGGYPGEWTQYPRVVAKVHTLNVHEVSWKSTEAPEYQISALVGNGCALEFTDNSYDIVFSNSVIEHVGGWENQCAFASEVRRVGRVIWVQTPAYECPIEPHFMALFIHWLPFPLRVFAARWLTLWGWLQRPDKKETEREVSGIRLISKKEFKTLFPDCDIHTERLLGIIPKSYIAIRK